jgi:hypothetical protein
MTGKGGGESSDVIWSKEQTESLFNFIEQKGECIIRYCGRPCDEIAERVWPIKISDGARTTLFNKGPVTRHRI